MQLVDHGQAQAFAPDDVLVQAAQQQDAEAFGQLYDRYFDQIHSYLSFKLNHAEECEDLAAQVFLKALESIGSYRTQGLRFSAWLFRIAHNLVVDYLRAKARRQMAALDERLPDGRDFGDPQRMLDELTTREALVQAVARLTPLQQQVVVLKFVAGLSNAEAAAVTGRSEGAIKAVQHAALDSLRRHYSGSRCGHAVA